MIGREDDVRQITRLLATPHCRLITLLGVGGIGKTRLALEIARALAGDRMRMFLYGVVFVPLAGIDTTTQIVSAVAQALGLALPGDSKPEVEVLRYLSDKEILLLLDNFEQLINEQTLSLLMQMLDAAPTVKFLIT